MAQAPSSGSLRARIGRTVVDAAETDAVARAIEAANAHQHWSGVPESLNPRLLDTGRVLAMLVAIEKLPDAARARLGHHAVLLDTPGLPVRASSPTTPASFAKLSGIEVGDVQGDAVEIRLTMPLDCALARQNASAAKQAVETVSGDVASLEKARRTATGDALTKAMDDLGAAKRARFLLAIAWHENAQADAGCRPGDAGAKADLAAATRARRDYVVATGGIE
jgi:hypothetical protein